MSEHDIVELQAFIDPGLRTGVIIGMAAPITNEHAERVRLHLEQRFPGATFAVVGGCTAVATFPFDAEPSDG